MDQGITPQHWTLLLMALVWGPIYAFAIGGAAYYGVKWVRRRLGSA